MKALSAKISSAVAGVIGLVAIIHPGFHVSQSVQEEVVAGVTFLVTVLMGLHIHVNGRVAAALSHERATVNSALATVGAVNQTVKTPAQAQVAGAVAQVEGVTQAVGSLMSDVVSSPDQNL